jgi:hypothetical protein
MMVNAVISFGSCTFSGPESRTTWKLEISPSVDQLPTPLGAARFSTNTSGATTAENWKSEDLLTNSQGDS